MSGIDAMRALGFGTEQLSVDGLRLLRYAALVDRRDATTFIDRVDADARLRVLEAELRRRGEPLYPEDVSTPSSIP